eukprot:scaffold2212_cov143-Cylindrotheca_fusiformis.AAC.13
MSQRFSFVEAKRIGARLGLCYTPQDPGESLPDSHRGCLTFTFYEEQEDITLLDTSIVASILLLLANSEAFTSTTDQSVGQSSSQLFFKDDGMVKTEVAPKSLTLIKGKKPTIATLTSLDDLKMFLEEDNRMAAIKFYAPWCKTCQRLGLQFQRLATELGDGIAARQKVKGAVRFAEISYSPETNYFIQEQLQVDAVPTLQLYHGLHKVWQRSGTKDTKDLREQVYSLKQKDGQELVQYAEQQDDGILQHAIEDSLYEYPDFLNEEW